MRFLVIVVLFCLTVAGAAFLAKAVLLASVEAELESMAAEALERAGYTDVKVVFDHLDGNLSGYVDRPGEVAKVISLLAASVPAAHWPDPGSSDLAVRPTRSPTILVARGPNSERVKIEGLLSDRDEAARTWLGGRVHAIPGIAAVDNGLSLDPSVLPFGKMAEFASLVTSLFSIPGEAEIALDGGSLKVVGKVPNEGLKSGLIDLAGQLEVGRIVDEIAVKAPDPLQRPSELRLTRNRFGISLSGVLPADADRTPLMEGLRQAVAGGSIVDRIEADPTCTAAPWQGRLPQLLPILLKSLSGEMTAEFSASRIRVNGTAVDAEASEAVVASLEPFRGDAPPYDLLLEIEEVSPATGGAAIELSAVYESGLVTLSGRLSDPAIGKAIKEALEKRLPEVRVKNEIVGGAAEADWCARFPEFFAEVMPRVSSAEFRLREGVLELNGRTVALPDRQIIQNLAVNTVPDTIRVHNLLRHADQPFPKPVLQAVDLTRLAETLKSLAIYFDKSSDLLKVEENAKIASIYDAIKAFGSGVEFVVTGFSDHVGSSTSNEDLSLRRAERVRAELVRLGLPEASFNLDSFEEDVSGLPRSEQWRARRVEVSLKTATPTPPIP